MGKRKRKSSKKKRKKRKVESSSSSDSSDSSSSDSEEQREQLLKAMKALVDLMMELNTPILVFKQQIEKLQKGEKVNIRHMTHKKTKKLMTKIFFYGKFREKKRDVWKMGKDSADLLEILQDAMPKKCQMEEAVDLVNMLLTEDAEGAGELLPHLFHTMDSKEGYELAEDPKHLKVFAELLFEYLGIEKSGDSWKATRSTPSQLGKLFAKHLKVLRKIQIHASIEEGARSEDGEVFGCELPSEIKKRDAGAKTIGPALPQAAAETEQQLATSHKRVFGPAVPSTSELIHAAAKESDESSDEDYGPANLAEGDGLSKQDKRRLVRMQEVKELQAVEDKYKKDESKGGREEWMSMPPAEGFSVRNVFDQKNRGFSTKESDNSAWTMTEKDRQLKRAKEAEIAEIRQKYGTAQAKKKRNEPEFKVQKQQSMVETFKETVKNRIVIWEVKRRRGIRVGPRPSAGGSQLQSSIVPQNFVSGGVFL